ncbi:MAG TPA: SDR family NAD(P)-dependent oxidoreductase [Sphingobium sp.]|uniref:SDR family NAD(P)-dependent oxidoreductase n=1 Tax=Sphingobium sp. TaxID=1912891 RepID=UPI002ED31DA7
MNLAEKYGPWALISGASEGTGSAFARRLAGEGINLILIARREGPLKELADELTATHDVECVTATIDLAKPDAIDAIKAVSEGREVGLFIANAGGDPNGTGFFQTDIQNWVDLVTRNVMTVLLCCHHFGGAMRERRRGGIILVGSGACYGGASGLGVYSGTKAFDLCLGEGLWAELRRYDVDVLNLILGRTDTPEFRRHLASRGAPVPAGLASPEDVARVGLERLPHGPVHNWGLEDDEQGRMPQSAATRRDRILAMEAAMQDLKMPK